MFGFAAKKREYDRAHRGRDDVTAERLAVELAPYFDKIAEVEDENPKAITPQWGLLA
jgi:hypothetical protein